MNVKRYLLALTMTIISLVITLAIINAVNVWVIGVNLFQEMKEIGFLEPMAVVLIVIAYYGVFINYNHYSKYWETDKEEWLT